MDSSNPPHLVCPPLQLETFSRLRPALFLDLRLELPIYFTFKLTACQKLHLLNLSLPLQSHLLGTDHVGISCLRELEHCVLDNPPL